MILYIDNTNVIELRDLKDSATGDPVTTAVVTAQLLDGADADVGGSVSMPHDQGGLYRGEIPHTVDTTGAASARVTAIIGATQGQWTCPVRRIARACDC